jgi:hypothetical protein
LFVMYYEALLLIPREDDPGNLYAVTAQASACAFFDLWRNYVRS